MQHGNSPCNLLQQYWFSNSLEHLNSPSDSWLTVGTTPATQPSCDSLSDRTPTGRRKPNWKDHEELFPFNGNSTFNSQKKFRKFRRGNRQTAWGVFASDLPQSQSFGIDNGSQLQARCSVWIFWQRMWGLQDGFKWGLRVPGSFLHHAVPSKANTHMRVCVRKVYCVWGQQLCLIVLVAKG